MYSWIDNTILGLKETYYTENIYDLFDELEIIVKKLQPNNVLLQGNEAFYNRNYLGLEVIFIRNDLNRTYEKFILAHELGHALLHTNMYQATFNKNLLNIGKLEKQANYFAIKILDIKGINNIDQINYILERIEMNARWSTKER